MSNVIPFTERWKQPRIDLAAAVPLAKPITVYIEPTNRCNFKCGYCPESFSNYKEGAGGFFMLSPDDFKIIESSLEEIGGVTLINWHMLGEPFLNKNLLDYVKTACDKKLAATTILTTNGTMVTPDKYAAVCTSGLTYLRVSIYGATDKLQEERTQSKVPLSKVVDNITGLKRYRDGFELKSPHIYVKFLSTTPEEDALFMEKFKDAGDEVSVTQLNNFNSLGERNLSGVDDDTLANRELFKFKKKACPYPFYTLIIHSDLNVGVCCVDWNKQIVVGNLRKNTLKEIWHGDALHQFQLKHLALGKDHIAACAKCTFLYMAPDNLDDLSAMTYASRLVAGGRLV